MKWLRRFAMLLALLLIGPLFVVVAGDVDIRGNWQTASRESSGIAPSPKTNSEAIVQVYAARAFSWRGMFGVHTWIATKSKAAKGYRIHQVLGWRVRHGGAAISSSFGVPDRYWFGNRPTILTDLRGIEASKAIKKINQLIINYPYKHEYTLWPGPNSNTFIAHLSRNIPELKTDLPPTAIGKDYLVNGGLIASSPSNTGYQFSIFGLFGILASFEEGLEVNIFGLSFGIDPLDLAIKLPGIGRLQA
ncbi:DUF3750 domain-containing protein [Pseudomonadota bacterium]